MVALSAHRYLELLQQQVYTSLGQLAGGLDQRRLSGLSEWTDGYLATIFPEIMEAERLRRSAAMGAQLEREVANLPTSYEDPLTYGVLREYVESLEETGKAAHWPLPPRPVIGTLPTGRVNALTVRVPGADDYLVLFESHFFLFTMLLSKAILRAFPEAGPNPQTITFLVDDQDIYQRIESEPSVVGRFADAIRNYVLRGSPVYAEPYHIEPGHMKALELFRASSDLFALGHEYGHIVAKHLEGGSSCEAMIQDTAVESIAYSWYQEYEADAVGVRLSMQTVRYKTGADTPLCYWGAEMLFAAIDIVDRAVSLLRTGDESIQQLGSHPPAKLRREELRAGLLSILTNPRSRGAVTGKEQADAAAQLGSRLEYVVEQLWKRTRPEILALRAAGAEPAASWTSPQTRDKHP